MAIGKCVRCETVFSRVGAEEICPQCEQQARRFRQLVDDYRASYPHHDARSVAIATGVPATFIESYLGGGSAQEALCAHLENGPRCARCGIHRVEVGVHCRRCTIAIRNEVRSAVQEAKHEEADQPKKHVSLASDRRDGRKENFRAVRYRYEQ